MDKELEMEVTDDSGSDDSNNEMEQQNTAELKAAQERLALNDLDYDAHLNLIKILRKTGELDALREARENFSKVYPLAADLWMEWLTDEQSICTSDEERVHVKNLFDRAVIDYMSVKLWVEYIMFMLGGNNMDATRDVTERALHAVGTHMSAGILVWQAVLLVEQQFYATIDATETKKLTDQKKRIQALYRRRAKIPLMNTDKESFLAEAAEWMEEKDMVNLRKDIELSVKQCEKKIPFETALLNASTETEKLEAYRKYFDYCRTNDNPTVIQNLYERCVAELCLNAGIWEEYVRFAIELSSLAILSICERSQRNCPWSATLCELRLRCLKKFFDGNQENLRSQHKQCLMQTLRVGLAKDEDLIKVWKAYLVMLRLDIKSPEDIIEIQSFRIGCAEAGQSVDFLISDVDNDCEIQRYQAKMEATYLKNIEKTRQLYNEVIFKKGNNFKKAEIWLEFIYLERAWGCDKYARKLFRRALERVWDKIEWIGKEFKQFEEECGDLESLEDFEKRYISRLLIVQKKRQEELEKLEKEEPQKKFGTLKKEVKTVTRVVKEPAKRKLEHVNDSPNKKPKIEPHHGVFVKHDPKNDYRTVFLQNLDFKATESDILPIFEDCGKAETLRLTKNFKGFSKGFGYLVFEDSSSVFKALKKDRTPMESCGGRPIFVSKCNPDKKGHEFKYAVSLEKDKLFVKGLPTKMTENEIRETFAKHAPVKSCRLVTLRNGFSKGTCYIEFFSAEEASKVRDIMDGQLLDGKPILVLISDPSKKNATPKTFVKTNPSQKLSMLPRALANKSTPDTSEPTELVKKSNDDFRKMLLK